MKKQYSIPKTEAQQMKVGSVIMTSINTLPSEPGQAPRKRWTDVF